MSEEKKRMPQTGRNLYLRIIRIIPIEIYHKHQVGITPIKAQSQLDFETNK